MAPAHSFPLFDFPNELIDKVIKFMYDEPWEMTVAHDEFLGEFEIKGVPSIDVLLTCKRFNDVAGPGRLNKFNGVISLESEPELHPDAFTKEWKGLPAEHVWIFDAVETVRVNGVNWPIGYMFINMKRLEVDLPNYLSVYFTLTDNTEDIIKHQDPLIEALDSSQSAAISRAMWGIAEGRDCIIVTHCRIQHTIRTDPPWTGEVLVKYVLHEKTTKIVEMIHNEELDKNADLHLIEG